LTVCVTHNLQNHQFHFQFFYSRKVDKTIAAHDTFRLPILVSIFFFKKSDKNIAA
jgi:hypothetical protein